MVSAIIKDISKKYDSAFSKMYKSEYFMRKYTSSFWLNSIKYYLKYVLRYKSIKYT